MMNQDSIASKVKQDDASLYASTKSNNYTKQVKQLEILQNNKIEEFSGYGYESDRKFEQGSISKDTNQKTVEKNKIQNHAINTVDKIIKDIQYGLIDISEKKIDLNQVSKINTKNEVEKQKQKYLNPEQHKKLIKKFTNERKRFQKVFQQRSIQIQQKIRQNQEQEKRIRQNKQERQLSQRKIRIQERLNQLNELKVHRTQQLKLSKIESANLKQKKQLQDINKEEKIQKIFKPLIQQQKKILEQIKNQRKPMDFKEIKSHQEKYLKKKQQQSNSPPKNTLNWNYQPPTYVSKSYLNIQQEEKQKQQQKIEKQKIKEFQNRKKQKFIQFLNQNFKQKIKQMKNKKKQRKLQREEQKKINSTLQVLTLEKIKQKGNNYLQFNKMKSKKKTTSEAIINNQSSTQNNNEQSKQISQLKQDENKKTTPSQLLSLKKQMRIKNQINIRSHNLKSILDNKNKSSAQKSELLKIQSEKLDELAKRKLQMLKYKSQYDEQHNETVDIIVTSIKAKIKILQYNKQ